MLLNVDYGVEVTTKEPGYVEVSYIRKTAPKLLMVGEEL